MKARVVLAAAALAAVSLAAWLLADAPPDVSDAPAAAPSAPRGVAPRQSASGVAVLPTPVAKGRAAPRTTARASPAPSLFGDFLKARSYRGLYDRLQGFPEGQTAEGRFVLHEILRECATITDGRRWNNRPAVPKREEFVAALAPSDIQRDKRIAAFDDFTANRCAGFEGVSMTRADLSRMLQDAAAAGDPRARALAIEQELWQSRRTAGDSRTTLTDAQIDALRQAVATRDPEAIRAAGRVLSTAWNDYAVRIGQDQLPVEARPFMNAWLVLACEYGAPCGADTPRMQQLCALQGYCAESFPEYLAQYAASPHDSMLIGQYSGLLRRAIETGDWSQVGVVRGVPAAGNRMSFFPGPR